MDATYKEERPPNPRAKANVFEIITFSWVLNLIKKGLKRDLDLIDLYTILDEDSSALLGSKLEKLWKEELIISKKQNRKPSYFKALYRMFKSKIILYGIYITVIEIILSISIAIIVGHIVMHFESKATMNQSLIGIYLAIILITMILLKSVLYCNYNILSTHVSMKARVATCNLIYNKALRLKVNTHDQPSTGHIVNLMSNDVNRLDRALLYIPYIWIGPLETIVITCFLWQEVGVSSLLGVATFLVFIPLQMWLGSKTTHIRLKTAIRTDERVNLMSEILSSLQMIKMYTWEPFFDNLARLARKKEINKIVESSYIKAILSSFFLFNSRLALFINVFAYVLLGNYITASKIFVITSYYNILRLTMTVVFTPGIGVIAELLVSVKRIENFLLREEKDKQPINHVKTANGYEMLMNAYGRTGQNNIYGQNATCQLSEPGIVITNATAKWSDAQADNSLENINLTLRRGRLVAVIGPVGAGKSTLIQAILRELPLVKGNIFVHGVVSYASQEPWLFAGSIQQNILFGLTMDRERYEKVIEVCALKKDFENFPYGDRTIVGEKGVSLSGGQRARINLARTIYKQADVYLLDDPLSAVDTRVGKYLFEKCIKGYLKEKTCLLITHRIQYLTGADHIIFMEKAKVIAEGSYQQIQTSGLNIKKFLGPSSKNLKSIDHGHGNDGANNGAPGLVQRSVSCTKKQNVCVESSTKETNNNQLGAQPIQEAETHSCRNVGVNVYLSYIFAGGHHCKILGLVLVCVLTQILASGGDYWISYWVKLEVHVFGKIDDSATTGINSTSISTNMSHEETRSRQTCIVVFGVLTVAIIISALAESALLVSFCTTASMNLHNRMFGSISRATMEFLIKNPSGRILNRFSKDMGLIDEILPATLISVVQVGLMVVGIFAVVGIINPYLIPPSLMIITVFLKMRNIYLTTTRNIKRLEGVASSPIFTHVKASLQGLTTIRAFNVEDILSEEFAKHQDLQSSAWFLFISLNRAFGCWLYVACIFYISIIIFCFILIGNGTYGGNIGLAITQAIGLTSMFQRVIKQSTELETQMTSVERVLEYTVVPQELALESAPDKIPPEEWPDKGRIVFKQFHMRYDTSSPYVLKNLNIKIEPMEKIGIVGRTGAGKSSLISALFRLAYNEGSIVIDGLDIHELGLHDLRSKISIIPQEPFLFSGTLRKNLDPFNEHSDHSLWKALEEVELKDIVNDLPDGLNSKTSEGGSNLSVGQRQLVCLARAIVRSNKILILDEATANVDPQTEELIQYATRNKFRKCTVLTIAHRLNTVMNSDKILVMDTGSIVEFDHPHVLLQNKDGYLYKMVEQTGQTNADLLHSMAVESFKNKYL